MFKDTLIGDLLPIWLSVQTDLSKVLRWSNYAKEDKKLRRQSTLAHQYSICVVIIPALYQLKKFVPELDTELLKDAFTLHDIPEGLLKMKADIVNNEKIQDDDINEHSVFKKSFNHLEGTLFEYLHNAYLVQFAHKETKQLDMFLPETINKIENLRKNKPYEVKLFRAIECWEYIFYGYEAFLKNENVYLLVNILRRQVPDLQQYAKELVGFREVFFPKKMEIAMLNFIEQNKHLPPPPKQKK